MLYLVGCFIVAGYVSFNDDCKRSKEFWWKILLVLISWLAVGMIILGCDNIKKKNKEN